MKSEIKQKWLAALRSEEYKQTKHGLKRKLDDGSFGYCCLGVLCDIAIKENPDMKWDTNSHLSCGDIGVQIYGVDNDPQNVLTRKIADWAGLVERNPSITYTGTVIKDHGNDEGYESLATLNDHHGCSFKEIAQVIEEQI